MKGFTSVFIVLASALILPSMTLCFPSTCLAQCSPSAEKPFQQPCWKDELNNGNEKLRILYEAISGKEMDDETRKLLRGVTKISRARHDSFELQREDSAVLNFSSDTIFGDKIRRGLDKAQEDTDKYGEHLSELISSLKAVSVDGDHIELIRTGSKDLRIRIKDAKRKLPIKLKELRISKMSLDLDQSKGFPTIKNIEGLKVMISVGFEIAIVPKEFWRSRNAKGDTVVTFGVVNPLPKPIRAAFRMGEVAYFSHTLKKKESTTAEIERLESASVQDKKDALQKALELGLQTQPPQAEAIQPEKMKRPSDAFPANPENCCGTLLTSAASQLQPLFSGQFCFDRFQIQANQREPGP